ncbi:MAG: DinB family protein [Chitinophagaceae bacterium]
MKEQLLDTWNMHQRLNLLLLDNTGDTGMQKSLGTRAGRTVYLQFLHLHHVRMQWLEICAKDLFQKNNTLDKTAAYDRKLLRQSLESSANAIGELLARGWDDGGKIKGFKKGVLPLLGYFISHESHHRGNILLTLKQNGEKIPDAVKWGLWEWGK